MPRSIGLERTLQNFSPHPPWRTCNMEAVAVARRKLQVDAGLSLTGKERRRDNAIPEAPGSRRDVLFDIHVRARPVRLVHCLHFMTTAEYSAEQLAAIRCEAPRILCVAGPGSGKTRTLVGCIKRVLDGGVEPQRICAVTFTTAAARVLTERVGCKLGFCGTLHALLLRLLNQHADLVGYDRGVGVVDEDAAKALLEQVATEQRFKGAAAALETALSDWSGVAANPTAAQLVVAAYRRRLRTANAVDFNGILSRGAEVVRRLGEPNDWPFTHLFVDEFQDTSAKFADIYEAMPVGKRFYVGDKNQSVFSFLGGCVGNMAAAAQGATIVKLETNYRCCTAVCRAATALIAAPGGAEKTVPRTGAPEGRAECREFADFQAEVKAIAQKIRELDTETSCAVLLRTNVLCDSYRAALEGYGLPVAQRVKAAVPPDWPAVRALMACLNAPDNDLTARLFIAAIKGLEQAERSWREAVAAQVSINEHCLHFDACKTAKSAVAFVLSTKPSAESCAKVTAALEDLEPNADVSDMLLALAEPRKAEAATPGVFVSTYHSAKGMEFRTVVLAAFEEGVLPSFRDAKDPELLAEARRLAYVGMTRAEDYLLLTHCRERQERFGRFATVQQQVSRFATEAGLVDA